VILSVIYFISVFSFVLYLVYIYNEGRAVAQAVSRLLSITAARVRVLAELIQLDSTPSLYQLKKYIYSARLLQSLSIRKKAGWIIVAVSIERIGTAVYYLTRIPLHSYQRPEEDIDGFRNSYILKYLSSLF
jgi:hypothetical protein